MQACADVGGVAGAAAAATDASWQEHAALDRFSNAYSAWIGVKLCCSWGQ